MPDISTLKSNNLQQRDREVIWHPFTQMKTAALPLPIVRGIGAILVDELGQEYIDAISSWWVNLHGHAHPYIARRIYEQASKLEHVIFAGFTHQPAVELGEKLLQILPSKQAKIFFSDNGSTAVEVALKMAIQYFHNKSEKRTKILALENAYHGDTFGAMSVGDDLAFNRPFASYMFSVERIVAPIEGMENKALEQLDKLLEQDDVAAFIFEPLVQGSAGMIMHSPKILDQLIAKCQAKGVLCIADEVMTGFGRTGKTFASDYLEHQPDLMCLSKGLTGGTLPLSITTCTEQIYQAFLSNDKMKTFFHGHSYTANPLGCSAALASMELLLSEETQANIQRICDQHAAFKERIESHPALLKIRQRGTILALEFKTGEATSYFNNLRDQLYYFFLERGVLLRPLGNVIYILPPYVIKDNQLSKVYNVIEAALDKFGGKK